MIPLLPGALSWTTQSNVFDSIDRDYRRHLFMNWGRALMKIMRSDRAKGDSVLKKARALPETVFQSFIIAPQIVYWLDPGMIENYSQSIAQLFDSALEAELHRLHISEAESEIGVWSALGDYYRPGSLPPDCQCPRKELSSEPSEWTPDSLYQATSLSINIPLDFVSPFTRISQMEVDQGPYAEFSNEERVVTLAKIEEALEGLARACPESYVFTKLFTRVIIGRKSLAQMGSISYAEYIGATIIANPHRAVTDSVKMAEGIVHEAIHHMLYSLEMTRGPFIPDQRVEQEFEAVSPWSGRKLSPRHYLHACFVWFGLVNLWRHCKNFNVFSQACLDESLSRATLGFSRGSLLDPLSDIEPHIPVELRNALTNMQETVEAGC